MTDTPNVTITTQNMSSEGNWSPHVGQETMDFLTRSAPEESRESLEAGAISILSKGVSPDDLEGTQTGLVIGYVQSGKTMSFETVTALARDNGFQIVIVIAGVTTNLLNQSTERMANDLGLRDSSRPRRWVQLENPNNNDESVQFMSSALDDWRDPDTPDELRRTVLVTVLKQHQRLGHLTSLLSSLDFTSVSVLIIDDEADQASLNNETSQDSESTTYARLMELRSVIPQHTYLQYTATPQAPLLINIIDSLSPNFVEVLEPGSAYVGGRDFFKENPHLIVSIPPGEVPTRNNPLVDPPETLMDALRVFIVGIAAAIELGESRGNRSMLVHPSHLTAQHNDFYNWIRDSLENWKSCLNQIENDPDRQELLDDLRIAHSELQLTVGDGLPSFDQLARRLRIAINRVQIMEVNATSGKTPKVDWPNSFGWILVGGAAMDRGFTIEGLTVTYMPRGIGVGNADTVQQRARFFGYKRGYLGYCRVYLEDGTKQAFEDYVDHEEDIRNQLLAIQQTGQPLNNWKRAFVMSSALQPCRDSVLDFDYMHVPLAARWISPRFVLATSELTAENRESVQRFIQSQTFVPNEGHRDRTQIQRHSLANTVSLQTAMENLLVPFRVTGATDSQRNTALLLQLSKVLEDNPDETCAVYQMSSGQKRLRGVGDEGEIKNLYQGEAPVRPLAQRGLVYPGDQAVKDAERVTVQIHYLDLRDDDETIISPDTYVLAVYVPRRLAESYVVQQEQ